MNSIGSLDRFFRSAGSATGRRSSGLLKALGLSLVLVAEAGAVDRIALHIQSLQAATGTLTDVRLDVGLEAVTSKTAHTRLQGEARVRSLRLAGDREALDLPPLQLKYQIDAAGWQLNSVWRDLSIATVQGVVRRYVTLPSDLAADGRLHVTLEAHGSFSDLVLVLGEIRLEELAFANDAGDLGGEALSAEISLAVQQQARDHLLRLHAYADGGAALIGPVYLEFAARPLEIAASALLRGRRVELQMATLTQEGLIAAHGSGVLQLGQTLDLASTRIEAATVTLERLQFPAAYASLLQTALAGTVIGSLESSGEIAAELEIRDHSPQQARIELRDLAFKDTAAERLQLDGLYGMLSWRPAAAQPTESSVLRWSGAGAYGLQAGAAQIGLHWQGSTISLISPARLPILDGALRIEHFLLKDPGTETVRLEFSGELEPIGMPALARAFGWPAFSGVLRGRIPSVAYTDKVLAFEGDVTAEIFGGTLVGRDIRLTDPLGRWPRFSADLRFSDFDLETVSRTFELGTITGKLEGHIDDLELFAWSPVSFDALIRTPPNDRSRHRISVKAINSIANVGGNAGTGVATALQGGMLRFFSSYGYKRLTFRCRLENDVCLMSGEDNDERYYLLEGRGLPRVDIFGYAGRVRWSQLVEQVREQIESGGSDLRIEY